MRDTRRCSARLSNLSCLGCAVPGRVSDRNDRTMNDRNTDCSRLSSSKIWNEDSFNEDSRISNSILEDERENEGVDDKNQNDGSSNVNISSLTLSRTSSAGAGEPQNEHVTVKVNENDDSDSEPGINDSERDDDAEPGNTNNNTSNITKTCISSKCLPRLNGIITCDTNGCFPVLKLGGGSNGNGPNGIINHHLDPRGYLRNVKNEDSPLPDRSSLPSRPDRLSLPDRCTGYKPDRPSPSSSSSADCFPLPDRSTVPDRATVPERSSLPSVLPEVKRRLGSYSSVSNVSRENLKESAAEIKEDLAEIKEDLKSVT
jgi:hypothetical protein